MNNNIKAFHCCDCAANWLLMARIKNIVLHKLGLKMGLVEEYGWELARKACTVVQKEKLTVEKCKEPSAQPIKLYEIHTFIWSTIYCCVYIGFNYVFDDVPLNVNVVIWMWY